MMPVILDTLLAAGTSPAGSLVLKATLIVALALAASRFARRSRAAERHVLLAAAFAALLVLPLASLVVPTVSVEVPAAAPAVLTELPATPFAAMPDAPARAAEPALTGGSAAASIDVSPAFVMAAAWAVGAALFLVPVLFGLWQMRALRRSGIPWPRGRNVVQQLSRDNGIRRQIDVLLHERTPGPVTCGLVRPAIVLPMDATDWAGDDLQRAVLHELEHVRRGDWATQCLARVLCAAYWFHPLVWIARRQLALDAERACDDAVLRRAEATSYASQLVTLAERLSGATRAPLLAMADRDDLVTRVRAVLDSAQARGRAGAGRVAAVIAGAALLVAAIAPIRAVAQAQQPATAPAGGMAFDAASVRPNKSGALQQFIQRQPGGRFLATNMPLRSLITYAYQIQGFQLEGGPDWIGSERFDIDAKSTNESLLAPPGSRGPDPLRLMVQALLADRFKLVAHEETKELPIFELVMAKRDGKPGPQLKPAATDCASLMAARGARGAAAPPGGGSRGAPPPGGDARSAPPSPGVAGPDAPLNCGVGMSPGLIRFGGTPMTALADVLGQLTRRVVIDRTGLTGNFDSEMTYTPDPGQFQGPAPPGFQPPVFDPNGPSLFTALEDQLGLKLQSARGPVKVIVIDRVDRPTEN